MKQVAIVLVIFISACDVWDVKEPSETHLVATFVIEKQFRKVHPGMSEEEVTATIGAPEAKSGNDTKIWRYSIWRGTTPGALRMLLTSERPKGTIFKAQVAFVGGRVSRAEVIENSATPFPPANPRSIPAAEK